MVKVSTRGPRQVSSMLPKLIVCINKSATHFSISTIVSTVTCDTVIHKDHLKDLFSRDFDSTMSCWRLESMQFLPKNFHLLYEITFILGKRRIVVYTIVILMTSLNGRRRRRCRMSRRRSLIRWLNTLWRWLLFTAHCSTTNTSNWRLWIRILTSNQPTNTNTLNTCQMRTQFQT